MTENKAIAIVESNSKIQNDHAMLKELEKEKALYSQTDRQF